MLVHLVQLATTGGKVYVLKTDPLGLLGKLPVEVESGEDGDTDICGNELGNVPVASEEDCEAVEEEDEEHKDRAEPGRVRLEGSFVREFVAGKTLLLEAVVHAEVGHEDDEPGDKTGDRRDVIQPVENGDCGRGSSVEVLITWVKLSNRQHKSTWKVLTARRPNRPVIPTHHTGRPPFVHLRKNAGALPSTASAYNVREEAYKSELPALHAEIRMTALITLGRPLIPAVLIAMTNGLALASPLELLSSSSEL